MELITPKTSFDELIGMVDGMITPEDREILGVEAVQKIADSIAYLGAFVPAPATFDKKAFFMTTTLDLPEKEAERIWRINKRFGILKDESNVDPGRVSVSTELVQIAKTNFLTPD